MFIPEIEPQEEAETVEVLDALDTICDNCTSNAKCNKCPINDIKNDVDDILIELMPLPDEC